MSIKKPELSEDSLHGPIGSIVFKLRGKSEASEAAILFQFMCAIGNCIGDKAFVYVHAQKHFPVLFTCIVGNSAKARKGTSWSIIHFLMQSIEQRWADTCVIRGLSSGEGLISKTQQHIEKDNDNRLLIMEPEFANVLKTKERSGNNLSPILRQIWDSDVLQIITRAEPLRVEGYITSLISHITKMELESLFHDTDIHNGLANRILWIYAERGKLIPIPEKLDLTCFKKELDQISIAIVQAYNCRELNLTEGGKKFWIETYPELEEESNNLLDSLTSRSSPYVLRIAMIYAVIDGNRYIDTIHLEAALALWRYCLESTSYIFDKVTTHPQGSKLYQVLLNSPNGLTRTEIQREFGNHFKKRDLDACLTDLKKRRMISESESNGVAIYRAVCE